MDYKNLSLIELSTLIQDGKATSDEIYAYFLERVEKYNEELNAFTTLPLNSPPKKEELEGVTQKRISNSVTHPNLPLSGKGLNLPIAIKDLFCEKGVRTTAASKMLEDFVPSYESTVTDRIKRAGFVSFGKTNMDEYAMGGSGENSAFGPARNPWDPTRIPGGSSSGSAVAVAAWLVPAALGTDTGGSIRQPASMCGIVGWKPGYGRNSRYGVIAMASSLDTPGYFTRTVRDAGLLYEATAGHDPMDATSLSDEIQIDPAIWERTDLTGVRVGIPREYFIDGIDPGVRSRIDESIAKIRDMWAEIIDISLPHTADGVSAYYIICPAEVSSNMGRYDGIRYGHTASGPHDISANRSEWLGDEVKRRSMLGSFVLSAGFYDAYFRKATDVRELIRDDFTHAFTQVDVIVTPTAPSLAWRIGEKWDDPLALYLEDVFTIPASLAGIPGLTIPVGYTSPSDDLSVDLPVGLQILGPVGGEERCLMVGHVLEEAMREKVGAKKPKVW
jgi:aspartyl-tRNA(Asn)/glutamyl-tRNA(Gln) amidotransferase subunit A